jgi:hypothetical protein
MTLHEAYLKAKKYEEKYGRTRLSSCRDYGEFWGFYFVPPINKNLLKGLNGGCDITINKKTGEKSTFNPIMDLYLAKKSIPIPIDQFTEYNVAI